MTLNKGNSSMMKDNNIWLPIFAVLAFAVVITAATAIPESDKNYQQMSQKNSYSMQEPFSASALITYPSLEVSDIHS